MVDVMMVIGYKTKCMAKEYLLGLMAEDMKENVFLTRNKYIIWK